MTGNLAVRHALSNQAGDPALLLAQKFGPLSIGQKQRARAAKSLNDLFELRAARPYLSCMYAGYALAEHIEVVLRAEEDSLGSCAKGLRNQDLLGTLQENDGTCIGTHCFQLLNGTQSAALSILQMCSHQSNIDGSCCGY